MDTENDKKRLRENIRMLERALGILDENKLSCCGVTLAQCHALVEIGRAGSISLNELSELLLLDNSTMSRTVNNLVNSGLAKRELDPKDRRYVTISLTESGEKEYNGIESGMDSYFTRIFDAIPEEKRAQVFESLGILIKALQSKDCCK